ncbi:putative transmembrane protein [Rhodopirellula islandica]|uniref:Transmembrane protein n=1 Tax=Rhodopirellula islandica TaxID=595434 RepID=A0A0J1B4T8_RHOIS|nr:hypothetical protein [Rhodopirellula islandica]KLU01471.1 putative transmembrane protein [Rhodopirellula islandica]
MNVPDPDRVDSPSGLPPDHADALRERKQQLQAALIRVRHEAHAARLEANAARLEATASQIEAELESIGRVSIEQGETADPPSIDEPASSASQHNWNPPGFARTSRFASWNEVREAVDSFANVTTRHDPGHGVSVRAPKMRRLGETTFPDAISPAPMDAPDSDATTDRAPVETDATAESELLEDSPVSSADQRLPADQNFPTDDEPPPSNKPLPSVIADDDETDTSGRRRKPVAVIASAIVHVVLLFILAAFTLNNARPKDQMAFSASATSENEESAMETFSIESSEPVTEPTQSQPDETQYDVSEMGEMPIVDITSTAMDSVATAAANLSSLSSSSSAASQAMQKLSSDANSQMEFCGVEGGGNHFVYLVDSSGSMGDAFTSARSALLQSIDMLTEKQRFYVVFFDAECDYMQLSGSPTPESRSAYATPNNKQQLRNWAMRVSMDRGKAPYEPLRFALELKPDVIFLLSDGEFPQGIEDLLTEENRSTNLFGDTDPISIVHTISYHSREGESRMRRIAEKNFGQYRHVPKP